MSVDRVVVVGAGLIGTSIGLALARQGQRCVLVDADDSRAAAAGALGAGDAQPYSRFDEVIDTADHVVVCVPPAASGEVAARVIGRNRDVTVSDVASSKANVVRDVETASSDATRFCGGHPIAGRERGGPGAAQPTLFDGAVWAITPTRGTGLDARADAAELARRCGARVVELSPSLHDELLAVVSHLPQLVASALAAELAGAGPLAPQLAGQGFRDTTRLADSDPALWADIAASNAPALAPAVRRFVRRLEAVAAALDDADRDGVQAVVAAGNAARALLPGKARATRRAWARVGVVVADQPGELARLLATASAANVNVEDLAIEHAPDHPVGFVDLEVRPEQAATLLGALQAAGWAAHVL